MIAAIGTIAEQAPTEAIVAAVTASIIFAIIIFLLVGVFNFFKGSREFSNRMESLIYLMMVLVTINLIGLIATGSLITTKFFFNYSNESKYLTNLAFHIACLISYLSALLIKRFL
ncbi:MAG TPA: hypothetical protein VGQ59_19435 [Cyclobacteriaceae bacterium]|nr:hypothetical protein [Cyclobacteriaceae bacterium]